MLGPVFPSCQSKKIGFPGDESRNCLTQVWIELSVVLDVLRPSL